MEKEVHPKFHQRSVAGITSIFYGIRSIPDFNMQVARNKSHLPDPLQAIPSCREYSQTVVVIEFIALCDRS